MIRSDTKGYKHEVRIEAYSCQRPTNSGSIANLSQVGFQLVDRWVPRHLARGIGTEERIRSWRAYSCGSFSLKS